MKLDIKIVQRTPTSTEFAEIRKSAGWRTPEKSVVENALAETLFAVCALTKENQAIGCARVTGDGYMYFYVSDVIVKKEYQGQGIGKMIMEEVIKYLAERAPPGAFIGLFAAKGKEDFYKKYSFIERPNTELGPGMVIFKKYPTQPAE